MTVSARWYSARAADGIALVEAVRTTSEVSPSTPGATEPVEPEDTLAGAWMASVGTEVPSGSDSATGVSADTVTGAPAPAGPMVDAAESSASGTRVNTRRWLCDTGLRSIPQP